MLLQFLIRQYMPKGRKYCGIDNKKMEGIVLRMDGFHIASIFLAVLGKRFGDARQRDLLVES